MKPHGTISRYQKQKCRCDRCRAANKLYQRARRPPKENEFEPCAWRPVNGRLPVECWCQTEIVKVPVEDVRACRTISCGAPNCQPELALAT
jgi:hypothetical protein